jgi:hypothetical protein
MPREDRRISFDFTETYKAIFALCVQNEMPRPVAGSITAIDFKGDDGRCVAVRFANGLQGTSATSEYGQDYSVSPALRAVRARLFPSAVFRYPSLDNRFCS